MASFTGAITVLPLISSGQAVFNFDIPTDGWNNTGVPLDPDVSVSGTADFSSYPTFTLSVLNDSGISTDVTQVFILKPMIRDEDGNSLGRAEANSLDAILPVSDAPGWTFENKLDNNLKNVDGLSLNIDNYFGVDISAPPENRIDNGELLTFSFTMESLGLGESIDWLEYEQEANPHVLVKWQEVAIYGSAKGHGGFTPVPEPSQIAALSMAGLAGLLFVRRRIKAKRVQKN
jgi:hypothetical protein